MGIQRTDYIIIGYVFPTTLRHKKTSKVFDIYARVNLPHLEGHEGVECLLLVDHEFYNIIFGKVLAKSDSQTGFVLSELLLSHDSQKIKEECQLIFGDYVQDIGDPHLYTYSHFS